MRYRYEEYAPSNKRQYVIAVGVHELRALIDAARAVAATNPERTQEQRDFKHALHSSVRGLGEALRQAEANGDTGKRRTLYAGNEENDL